ncbi:MAG TPA: hypothetical protein VFI33_17105 [Puia sp.]|nr:hypothetical protein [Puia sp.]
MDLNRKQIQYFGRTLYSIAMGGIAIQQWCNGDFVNLISAMWPSHFPGYQILVYIFSAGLLAVAIMTLIRWPVKKLLIALGIVLFFLILISQIPFLYMVLPYKKTHLGVWAYVLKESALAGGAFVAARTDDHSPAEKPGTPDKLSLAGAFFFALTMFCFGRAHFLYADATATLVPAWIPGALFWVYFTGTSLMAAALCIVFRVKVFPASFILGCMIFIWFWIIHLPNALHHVLENQGNEISAALSALAFSGIAFMISGLYPYRLPESRAFIERKEAYGTQ